jgi:hypothetical protein
MLSQIRYHTPQALSKARPLDTMRDDKDTDDCTFDMLLPGKTDDANKRRPSRGPRKRTRRDTTKQQHASAAPDDQLLRSDRSSK